MTPYRHHVSGFFVKQKEAQLARAALLRRGIPAQRVALYANDQADLKPPPPIDSNETLTDILVDSAIGSAVGTAVGALGEVALVVSNVTLFVASPLIAPLAMLGWGATLGGTLGAVTGAIHIHKQGGKLSALIGDAIQSGQVVLVATTCSENETSLAIDVIRQAVGAYADEARSR